MSAENSSSSGGVGFVGLLTIVFTVLKLMCIIDWSWWWVVSPIWVAATGWLVAVLCIVSYLEARNKKLRRERLKFAEQRRKEPLR